jgi:hypothetical protein
VELNAKKALADLEDTYVAYLNSPIERRDELALSLRRSISRGEIAVGNVRDVEKDYEQHILQKRLLGTVELAKQSMPQNQGG